MKQINLIAGHIALLFFFSLSSGCQSRHTDDPIEQTKQAMLSVADSPTKSKAIAKQNTSFFLDIKASDQWHLSIEPEDASSWITLSERSGRGNASIIVKVAENKDKERTAQIVLKSSTANDYLRITQQGAEAKPTPDGEYILGSTDLIEIPRLAGGAHNYFITHRLEDGSVNYSLEYDTRVRHSRWVAFTFDSKNSQKHTKRSDLWAWDPLVPAAYSTETWFRGSGFDRGHLVASEDRVASQQANEQTFYYTNMSPQRGVLNQQYWARLEELVRSWGRDDATRDVVYVAKGGTIAPEQVEQTRLKGTMVIPRYYWMAIVRRKQDSYQGIAFWVEHKAYPTTTRHLTQAISIGELEQKTGLDLFYNLPDEVEREVEAQKPSTLLWRGL